MSRRYRMTMLLIASLFLIGLACTQPTPTQCAEHPRLCID